MWTEAYQLVQHLRCGEFATISLCARIEAPDEFVVVKEIRRRCDRQCTDTHTPDCTILDTDLQEVEAVTRVHKVGGHRHVVAFKTISSARDRVTLVMEHCAHGDLFTYLEKQPDRRVSEREALRLFQQAALGVQFLHANGIAHRDLSLENLLLAGDARELKICDFGLSTSTDAVCSERVGKFNYMGPEVVRSDQYDPVRADIWSLGVVLFILLTGSPLCEVAEPSDPAYDALQHVGVVGILRHWDLEHLYSRETVELLTQLLQLDPLKRIASVESILSRLSAYASPL